MTQTIDNPEIQNSGTSEWEEFVPLDADLDTAQASPEAEVDQPVHLELDTAGTETPKDPEEAHTRFTFAQSGFPKLAMALIVSLGGFGLAGVFLTTFFGGVDLNGTTTVASTPTEEEAPAQDPKDQKIEELTGQVAMGQAAAQMEEFNKEAAKAPAEQLPTTTPKPVAVSTPPTPVVQSEPVSYSSSTPSYSSTPAYTSPVRSYSPPAPSYRDWGASEPPSRPRTPSVAEVTQLAQAAEFGEVPTAEPQRSAASIEPPSPVGTLASAPTAPVQPQMVSAAASPVQQPQLVNAAASPIQQQPQLVNAVNTTAPTDLAAQQQSFLSAKLDHEQQAFLADAPLKRIEAGTTARGTVQETAVLGASDSLRIRLSTPIKTSDGKTAIPAEAQLIAQIENVLPGGFIQASAVQAILKDGKQLTLPPGAIQVTQGNDLLTAEPLKKRGGGANWLATFGLGALQNVGGLFTGTNQSIVSNSNGYLITNDRAETNLTNVAAGVLQGGANAVIPQIQARQQQAMQQAANQPEVLAVKSGKEVVLQVTSTFDFMGGY